MIRVDRALLAIVLTAAAVASLAAQETERTPTPGEVGTTEQGVRFEMPKAEAVSAPRPEPLRLERLEAHLLAAGTHLGEAGDLLVTFHGQGFLETARSPRVELADGEVVFDDTVADRERRQLFLIIPSERVAELERLSLRQVVVRNPGALEDTEYSRGAIETSTRELLRPAPGAPKARLVYRDGFFTRELVER